MKNVDRYDLPLETDPSNRLMPALLGLITLITLVLVMMTSECSVALKTWRDGVAGQMTVELLPTAPGGAKTVEDEARLIQMITDFPGIERVEKVTRGQMDAWLEPWLGAGNVLDDLPLPTLLMVEHQARDRFDLDAFRTAVRSVAPQAKVEDHRQWFARLLDGASMIRGMMIVVTVAALIVAVLMMALTVHQALIVHRDSLAILSLMGAHPSYIARQFQHYAFRLAFLGTGGGTLVFLLGFILLRWYVPEGVLAMVGEGMSWRESLILLTLVPASVVVTVVTATRLTVFSILRKQAYFVL